MKTKEEILNNELTAHQQELMDNVPALRDYIYDAMEEHTKQALNDYVNQLSNKQIIIRKSICSNHICESINEFLKQANNESKNK